MLPGRTSGVRTGTINSIKMRLKWGTDNWESHEVVAVGIRDNQTFSVPGDSGSWVFLGDLELCGMQIAHVEDKHTPSKSIDVTAVSLMEEIIFDIEQSTGGKVKLPPNEI